MIISMKMMKLVPKKVNLSKNEITDKSVFAFAHMVKHCID